MQTPEKTLAIAAGSKFRGPIDEGDALGPGAHPFYCPERLRWPPALRSGLARTVIGRAGIVSLTCDERDEAGGRMRDHAAATASRHWFAASARKIRSVERETRWR